MKLTRSFSLPSSGGFRRLNVCGVGAVAMALGGSGQDPSRGVDALKARLGELERKAKQRGDGGRMAVDWNAYFAEARDLLHRGAYGRLHFLMEDARARTLDMAR